MPRCFPAPAEVTAAGRHRESKTKQVAFELFSRGAHLGQRWGPTSVLLQPAENLSVSHILTDSKDSRNVLGEETSRPFIRTAFSRMPFLGKREVYLYIMSKSFSIIQP